jgi:hypothetical protein
MRERQVVGSDGQTHAVHHRYHRPPSQWQRVRVRRWSGPLSDRDIQAWQGHSPPCDGVAELLVFGLTAVHSRRSCRRTPATYLDLGIALRDVHLASRRGLPRGGAVT